jgi:hypothetical protein
MFFVRTFEKNKRKMAKPIKNTPVLKGKEAVNFYKTIDLNRDKKVSVDSLTTIQTDANKLKELLKVN